MSWPFTTTDLSVQPCGTAGANHYCIGQVADAEGPIIANPCGAGADGRPGVGRGRPRSDLQLLGAEIERLAGVADDCAVDGRACAGHQRQSRDIVGADRKVHPRQLELAAAGTRLHLVTSRRDVRDAERAGLIDPVGVAALLHRHTRPAAGIRRQQHHHAVRGRRSIGHQHLARDANQPRGDQSKTHAGVFLGDRQRDARRLGDIGGARENRSMHNRTIRPSDR